MFSYRSYVTTGFTWSRSSLGSTTELIAKWYADLKVTRLSRSGWVKPLATASWFGRSPREKTDRRFAVTRRLEITNSLYSHSRPAPRLFAARRRCYGGCGDESCDSGDR